MTTENFTDAMGELESALSAIRKRRATAADVYKAERMIEIVRGSLDDVGDYITEVKFYMQMGKAAPEDEGELAAAAAVPTRRRRAGRPRKNVAVEAEQPAGTEKEE